MRPSWLKHVLELRKADFEQHPVWVCAYNTDLNEPWYDDDPADEATYRPWSDQLPYDCYRGKHRSVRIAATFILADGTEMFGFCKAPNPAFGDSSADLSRIQPAVFVGDKSVWFWIGGADEAAMIRVRAKVYAALQRSPNRIFPIRYWIPDRLINVRFSDSISGFGRLLPPEYRTTVIER